MCVFDAKRFLFRREVFSYDGVNWIRTEHKRAVNTLRGERRKPSGPFARRKLQLLRREREIHNIIILCDSCGAIAVNFKVVGTRRLTRPYCNILFVLFSVIFYWIRSFRSGRGNRNPTGVPRSSPRRGAFSPFFREKNLRGRIGITPWATFLTNNN